MRFLSRLAKAGLGIVPFRRTLRHLRPYTFKQAIVFCGLSCFMARHASAKRGSPTGPKKWGSQSWLPPPFRRRDPLERGPQAPSSPTLFHEIPRAEGPLQQTTKTAVPPTLTTQLGCGLALCGAAIGNRRQASFITLDSVAPCHQHKRRASQIVPTPAALPVTKGSDIFISFRPRGLGLILPVAGPGDWEFVCHNEIGSIS